MFRGYCYSCNNYGHKVSSCQAYGRLNKIRRNHEPSGPLPNYPVECYNCHNYGHTARRCTPRPPRPRYTKERRRNTEVQNKDDDEDPTLEVDEVSKEEKHHSNEILTMKEATEHGRSSCSKPILEWIGF